MQVPLLTAAVSCGNIKARRAPCLPAARRYGCSAQCLCCRRVEQEAGSSWHDLQAEAFGRGDAGFGSTSRMVLEAGLTLALQVTAASRVLLFALGLTAGRVSERRPSMQSQFSLQTSEWCI